MNFPVSFENHEANVGRLVLQTISLDTIPTVSWLFDDFSIKKPRIFEASIAGATRRCPVKPNTPLGPDQVNVLLLLLFGAGYAHGGFGRVGSRASPDNAYGRVNVELGLFI
jgi:hypothetical protein